MNRLISTISTQFKKIPSSIKIVEVGPRDGLQHEPTFLPTQDKIEFINRLSRCGFKSIEVTSFVSPKWIPQIKDNSKVFSTIDKKLGVNYSVLVPNIKGLEAAIKVGVKEIAVFISASQTFSRKNTNCTIEESLIKVEEVIKAALNKNIKVRGYISCCFGCPYEGTIKPEKVKEIAVLLYNMGCFEIALGDTIGIGNPKSMANLLNKLVDYIPTSCLAIHSHDTYGLALPNIIIAASFGISTYDSSIAGLGGCPYAKNATGNVATEDLVYLFSSMGVDTGIDIKNLIETSDFICKKLNRESSSKVGKIWAARKTEKSYNSISNKIF